MTDWRDELGHIIRSWCKEQGITMVDQSERMGKQRGFLEKVARYEGVGHKAVLHASQYIPIPDHILVASEQRSIRVRREQVNKIARAKRERDERGYDCRQPWPMTVQKLKAEKPVYNW